MVEGNDDVLTSENVCQSSKLGYECSDGSNSMNIYETKLTCEPGCGKSKNSQENENTSSGCRNSATRVPLQNQHNESCTGISFLAPKSSYWPPLEIAQRSFGPARPIQLQNKTAEFDWFQNFVLKTLPSNIPQQPPALPNEIGYPNEDFPYALTEKEKLLVKMSFSQWKMERSAGKYSCMDMANALIKRAMYLQHVQHMNHFMYWDTFPEWTDVVKKYAQHYDDLTSDNDVTSTDILAPMYCYPVPLKGTMATIDFPSSLGFAAIIYNTHAVTNAAIVELLHDRKGISFGKTNIPEMAHVGATGNYHNGLAFNPWHTNEMTGGSSGGSAAAVASYTSAIALSEDTLGSTNVPAVRNHIFSYDPPKFRYPNEGNPSLSVRNDQVGIMARSIDDIIMFDRALLGMEIEHENAKKYVDSLKNEDIVIGCSHVYYKYDIESLTPSIFSTYEKAKTILRDSGFTLLEDSNDCQMDDPMKEVARKDNPFSVWYKELESYVRTYLNLHQVNIWEIILNGYYDFGTTLTSGWMFGFSTEGGCKAIDHDTPKLRRDYESVVPAQRADVYNKYFDNEHSSNDIEKPHRSKGREVVHLIMGPAQLCDSVKWTDDIKGTCDGGRGKFKGKDNGVCMFHCHPHAVRGHKDKTFTKSKFVVPIGHALNSYDSNRIGDNVERHSAPFSLHFMSRAGPGSSYNSSDWVFDKVGPKTWNMKELYIIQRITNTLADRGMERVDATMNFISGILESNNE